ncbi:MAG: deoxyguanosinetriphosphate triphosphohydrolase [Chloroflexi bacterium]|nr:deoxyguanosinetriphosphate triphosphohydrolase [Chloroflexota bacterium]MCY3716085.1 deoxyguanosinetriphosphate triphosphohydrolase [Chloroflexota bacterium]MDE2651406.1 deoxyguanosinetriphosphate triphosphohydrolase [Chloroflexota bacterium]
MMPSVRATLEAKEQATLAPYALFSSRSQGRVYAEPPARARTAFQRDRDRILHAAAFRRLQSKTQVFVDGSGDYFRTRLTHTLEVAQIGRTLARALGANEDLVEAICLAHDLGHPPFGHTGEAALDELLRDAGGFDHNVQGYRVLTRLENRYTGWRGLNLTLETLAGIAQHDPTRDLGSFPELKRQAGPSLEAQIANIADGLAYNAHDLDDGLKAGLLSPADCAELDLWHRAAEGFGWGAGRLDDLARHQMIRELVGSLVEDVLQESRRCLAELQPSAPQAIQQHPCLVVRYSREMREGNQQLKTFLLERLYRHPRILCTQERARQIIQALYAGWREDPRQIPAELCQFASAEAQPRSIADAIASLSDRSCLRLAQQLAPSRTAPRR